MKVKDLYKVAGIMLGQAACLVLNTAIVVWTLRYMDVIP